MQNLSPASLPLSLHKDDAVPDILPQLQLDQSDLDGIHTLSHKVSTMAAVSDGSSQRPSTASTAGRLSQDTLPALHHDLPALHHAPSPSPTQCRTTIVHLVSISATSSAFPESFGLCISPRGKWIVAYSSAALYIIHALELPQFKNCRAFRLRKRPLAVAMTDVGRFAVLMSSDRINIYQCGNGSHLSLPDQIQRIQTIHLNNEAKTMAFSSNGELVAAGSDSGVEIVGLGLPTGSDRRPINCGAVDHLSFSEDAKSLLATAPARRSRTSTFMSITGGFDQAMLLGDDESEEEHQPIAKLWISQLLFPEKISARQSVFLPDPSDGQASELLALNPQIDRFAVFDAAMKTFTHKVLDIPEGLPWDRTRHEDTFPGVSRDGSRVATAVRIQDETEIWTYALSTSWREDEGLNRTDSLQANPLRPYSQIKLPQGPQGLAPAAIGCLRWIEPSDAQVQTLIALVSTTAVSMPEDVESMAAPAASGKIVLFDFAQSQHSENSSLTLDLDEVDLNETLPDEEMPLEREVAIVRRRTQVQRTRASNAAPTPRLRRSASSSSRNSISISRNSSIGDSNLHSARVQRRRSFSSISDVSEDGGPVVAVDEPYSQSAPRPQFMLNRAATVAQNAPQTHLRALPSRPLEYRRADGMREMPHESDADDWVPPPPPYSERPDAPGPNAISLPITTIPGLAERVLQGEHLRNATRPPRNGMRARVSQVISNVQVPILSSQSSTTRSQTTMTRSSAPARPARSNQNVPFIPPFTQAPRSQSSRLPRRPVPAQSQTLPTQSHSTPQPQALPQRTIAPLQSAVPVPTVISPTPQMQPATPSSHIAPAPLMLVSGDSDLPVPGALASPMTFPGGANPRRNSTALRIPQTPLAQAASAPVTPITHPPRVPLTRTQNRMSQQYHAHFTPPSDMLEATLQQSSVGPTAEPSLPRSSTMESPLPRPNPPFANSVNRRVSSAELMRPLPPLPPHESTRHSSEDVPETPSRQRRPPVPRIMTQASGNNTVDTEVQTPGSRRQWWRVGSGGTPTTRSAYPAASSRPVTPSLDDDERNSRCHMQ